MKILGIDPALNQTGWGVIIYHNNNLKFLNSGIIKVNPKKSLLDKIQIISQEIDQILEVNQPDEIAIEEIFLNKNPNSTLKLGHARGAIIASVLRAELPVYEYPTRLIKKSVCGVGMAEKAQVAMMVKTLLPQAQFQFDDESDALATAICHTQHMNSYR